MSPDLTAESRRRLLALARASIEAHLLGRLSGGAETEDGLAPDLRERRGAFVTLRRRADGRLRGCVGRVETDKTLLATVAQMAVAAAIADRRFHPVVLEELPDLKLEISALSPAGPIRPEEVVVGRHGLIVRLGERSGLLLPQVALEYGWSRDAFLEWACRKAGLGVDAWRQPGCDLLGFTAIVFGES